MSTLLAAVTAAGVAGPLGDKNTEWTILAPNNDAFEDLLQALGISATQLLANKDLLVKVCLVEWGRVRGRGGGQQLLFGTLCMMCAAL